MERRVMRSGTRAGTGRIGEYEAAVRDYGFTAVRISAAVGAQVIGHRPLPE
jgi:hypothetical protein